MSNLIIPNALANGQPQDGNQVDANFDAIKTWADTHVVEKSGATLTGALTLSGNPATALVAAPKQYVDAHKPVSLFERSTDLTVANGASSFITFQTETNDVDGWWSSGDVFTVPASGVYAISVEFLLSAPITAGLASLSLAVATANCAVPSAAITTQASTDQRVAGSFGVFYMTGTLQWRLQFAVSGTGGPSKTLDHIKLTICRLAAI
jgi:hypothetical protein